MPLWETVKRTVESMREAYTLGERVRGWIVWVITIPAAIAVIAQSFWWPDEWGWRFCIVLGVLLGWTFAALFVTHLRNIQAESDPARLLDGLHSRGLELGNTWEEGFPAGPEAWRREVQNLYEEAEAVMRRHFTVDDALAFRAIKVEESEVTDPILDHFETSMRDLMLTKKIAFIYRLAHPE